MQTNRKRSFGLWLLAITILLTGCTPKSRPPGANSIGGSVNGIVYSYHYWKKGWRS